MIVSLDIETAAGVGFEDYPKAALDHHRNRITQIATYPKQLVIDPKVHDYAGWNFKFDLKTLITKGYPFAIEDYKHDAMLMAVAFSHKVPKAWLAQYEAKRKEKNKELGSAVHREAGRYSLKACAPYFLGVEPFWEVANHDDAEYAALDAQYTYELHHFFAEELKKEGSWEFYETKLMPWARMLLTAELQGISIDLDELAKREAENLVELTRLGNKMDEQWAHVHKAYSHKCEMALAEKYGALEKAAKAKLKMPEPITHKAWAKYALKLEKVGQRYDKLHAEARLKVPTKLNLDSPTQLLWALKDFFGLDVETFDGEDESTGKAVLQRLAATGRDDIKTLLEYRAVSKLAHAFFPSYRAMQWGGKLYCNFNLSGARTGRLSSNSPNLQQVPGHLHSLFVAPHGFKLVTNDLAAVEPAVTAYLSESQVLCELVMSGGSFHDENVRVMLGIDCPKAELKAKYGKERDLIKEIGLSFIYGAGAGRAHESATRRGFPWTLKEARERVNRFKAHHHEVYAYKADLDSKLRSGELIRNIFGRPVVPETLEDIHMQGMNTLVQGSASDLLLESARRVIEEATKKGIKAYPLLFVHDEMVFMAEDSRAEEFDAICKSTIAGWKLPTIWGNIPLTAEGKVAQSWTK